MSPNKPAVVVHDCNSSSCYKWAWKIPRDKSDRLLVQVGKEIKDGMLLNEEAMTLAGKINSA